MYTYREVRPDIDTGDLVLFSGKGGVSVGIRWVTRSRWSHVGMALRVPEWNIILLWEATPFSNVPDVESGRLRQGVQLTPLSEQLKRYEGTAAIRHLHVHRTPEMLSALQNYRKEVKGRPYEQSRLELIRSAWDGPFGANKEDLSSLFCSELVAEAYQRMGLLPDHPPSNEYTPANFSEKAELNLLRGTLGPERRLRPAEQPAGAPVADPAAEGAGA